MAIREGRWDCPSCGSTGIHGRHVDCPGCNSRPAGIRCYLSDDAPVVTDPERLREARAGADWVCEQCGASNRATEDNCVGCGADRGGSASQPVRDYGRGDVPHSGAASASAASASGGSARRFAGTGASSPARERASSRGAWDAAASCSSFPSSSPPVALRTKGTDASTLLLSADSLRECRRWHRTRNNPPPHSLGCSPRGGR